MAAPATETLSLPPSLDALRQLNDWYADQIARHGIAEPLAGNMKLCLNELVTNTVSYGFADTPAPRLSVTLVAQDGALQAEIVDNGTPFDPLAAEPAAPMDGIDTLQIGGFGIKLVRETASDLSYAREAGENRLTVICRADGGVATPAQ